MDQEKFNHVTIDELNAKHGSMFKSGHHPYASAEIKALAKGCPEFKDGKCPFWDIKNIGEFKAKLAEMKGQHKSKKSKENAKKAMEECQRIYESHSKTMGECTLLKSDPLLDALQT